MTRVWRDRHTIGANTSHFCREIAGSVDREGGGSKSPTLYMGGGCARVMFGMGVFG
jgi:hypothetical protein